MSVLDKMKITILADGTIKTTSDEVSPANHSSAETFLKDMARLTGGKTTREARTDVKHKEHHHHEHEGEHHHH